MNKLNLITAILSVIAAACFAAVAILLIGYAPFWVVALYAVCSSVDGINAFLHFKLWRRLRRGG